MEEPVERKHTTSRTGTRVPEAAGRRPWRGNVQTMREVNDLLVLNCLRDHQPIASIDIARKLGMEPATLCKVIRRLSEAGWMSTSGGRVPIAEMVASRFGVEAFVDENTNAFATAEKHFGFGRGASSFLCMWYRHGVGHALMIDGRLFRGARHSFGETRHYMIPDRAENRPADPLSAVEVRPQSITQVAARLGQEAGPFLSATLAKQTPEEVMAAVAEGIEAGDPTTMRAIDEIARAMSVSLSLLGDLFDPEVLIIGGPLTRWGAPMLELLRRHVGELADTTPTREGPPRLEFTRLGDDVIAFGGAALVMDRIFGRVGITTALP